jgi:hypothetical protein
MAKKRKPKIVRRTDAERRVRQGERLSRVLRVLQCIMGPGRWDANALAREIEVSPRTIHRIMATIEMANIPHYYCRESGCYRVREGFRLPGADANGQAPPGVDAKALKLTVDSLIGELNRTVGVLTRLSEDLDRRPTDR